MSDKTLIMLYFLLAVGAPIRAMLHRRTHAGTGALGRALRDRSNTIGEGVMQLETALQQQLKGYRLTTAEILYHLPDHPNLLQAYVWQEYDIAPDFPVLDKFLRFWRRELEGRLHSVRVASVGIVRAAEWRHAGFLRYMH